MNQRQPRHRRGYVDHQRVVAVAFWVVSGAISMAVLSAILAIWQFTGTDALWRTVATCAVIAAGMLAFTWLNMMLGEDVLPHDDPSGTEGSQ
jgi:peptidoglycan/LPS O-acetylase OafA/YrhL